MSNIYPKSPADLPKNLTSVSTAYKIKAVGAILSIILFFVLYCGLVAATGYLAYYSVIYPLGYINKFTIILKIGAIAGAVMLFVFTVKFIFKLKNPKITNRIKLNQKEYPELVEFVQNICKESGAPFPKNIYVDPDVNAYVSYSNLWLSLILPVRKDLTIGLGLTASLNLSEFKAVIAHEFGHFAQRSMKIGSYIVSANTIIHDMIFDRDSWDRALDQWRSADIRLSIFAWIITPVIWAIRQLLNLFYVLLNRIHASLSREMEFNADKFAVSLAGSRSIVQALWQLDFASETWNQNINHAYLAAQQNMFVENLYHHHFLLLAKQKPKILDALNALDTDKNGHKIYFPKAADSKVGMYSSHPPNDLREQNAKSPYIDCSFDERSPWVLFKSPEQIQTKTTLLIYSDYLQKKPKTFTDAERFEAFVKAENSGKELMLEYENTFENRFLNVPDDEQLNQISADTSIDAVLQMQTLKNDLKTLMKPVKEIEETMKLAGQIANGTTTKKYIQVNDKQYDKNNLQEGYNVLIKNREDLFSTKFNDWDKRFCLLHLNLALKISKEQFEKLKSLYKQHREFSKLYRIISGTLNEIVNQLNRLQSQAEVTQFQINEFGNDVIKLIRNLNGELKKIDQWKFIALPNLETAEAMKNAIVEKGAFPLVTGKIFENGGFEKMLQPVEAAVGHCQRIDQKSIAFILEIQHQLIAKKETT